MASRGSAIQRFLRYVREADTDEVRVALTLAEEIIDRRLAQVPKQAKAPAAKRTRRSKKELAEATDAAAEVREVKAFAKGETLADA